MRMPHQDIAEILRFFDFFFKTAAIHYLGFRYARVWTTYDESLVVFVVLQKFSWIRCSSFDNI